MGTSVGVSVGVAVWAGAVSIRGVMVGWMLGSIGAPGVTCGTAGVGCASVGLGVNDAKGLT